MITAIIGGLLYFKIQKIKRRNRTGQPGPQTRPTHPSGQQLPPHLQYVPPKQPDIFDRWKRRANEREERNRRHMANVLLEHQYKQARRNMTPRERFSTTKWF
ncbi:hypothetical protein ACFWPX_36285 [Nocardia sp. NPDC058518]|uniref:hypothetical protein n=1 Tax=Nocardia sp. NPDC058518 TaxID=3346534 RepID=UPI0036561444